MSHSPAHHSAVRSVWPWPEWDGSVRLERWLRPVGWNRGGEENTISSHSKQALSCDPVWKPCGVCWPHPGLTVITISMFHSHCRKEFLYSLWSLWVYISLSIRFCKIQSLGLQKFHNHWCKLGSGTDGPAPWFILVYFILCSVMEHPPGKLNTY